MMARHSTLGRALGAVLAVLAFGVWHRETAEPGEIVMTGLAAAGAVYGGSVWWRRMDFLRWWRGQGKNGLLGLTIGGHVTLRGAGALMQACILAVDLTAMGTPPSIHPETSELFIQFGLAALTLLSTFSCWYAERVAERQFDYLLKHPEEH